MPTQSRRIDPTATVEDTIATLTNATTTLPVANIRRDGGTQIRLQVNQEKIAEYADMITAGIITVHGLVFYDGSEYWLGDGFHRISALTELKRTHAHVEVRAGTRRDAVLYAATQANNTHGLPLTKEDRRNAALTLLRDKDWSAWTDREIGRRVGLSHPTVAKLRVQVEDERRSNAAAQKDARSETSAKRKVMRGGTVYEMNVEAIGNTTNTLASNQQTPLSQSDGRGAGGEGLPTTRQLVATWLDQRSSSPAARRVLVQQLIENNPTGKLLWRGLLQYLPGIENREDVLPHLRAELAKLEETATVNGVRPQRSATYQQVTIEDEGIWKNLPDTHSTPTPLTVAKATGPKQPMTQRSHPVSDLAASYEKHVIAWANAQCAAGNFDASLKKAAMAALKPDSEAFASMCAYMSEHVDAQKDWTQNGALIIAIGDVGHRLIKEDAAADRAAAELSKTPATIATDDEDNDTNTAAYTQQSSPRPAVLSGLRGELEGGSNTAASHQHPTAAVGPLSQSDGRGAGGIGVKISKKGL